MAVKSDWDFPTFEEPLEIQVPTKVLGTFHEKLQVTFVARLLRLIPQPKCSCWKSREGEDGELNEVLHGAQTENLAVSIHGKWLQYGPLFVVMFIDLLT
ncbi:hypothetical protein AK812_SmicGene26611 [Symbiodinium microadriaticum]|uniref:Uncharacterized protein n=1 Tax=Symbiodinium microadriaticum TaxID=2951 RepID=A0A1Q9D8X6_SYMMI|nr:hypothetical protein AK812_SmicGene26611 [Symbiodinium microadriaticum]